MSVIQTAGGLPAQVYAIDMAVPFRGITRREGVLIEGPAGWGEFSPFWDYDAATCLPWWRAALEMATSGYPPALRDQVPVNATVPAVGPEAAVSIVRNSGGCRTVKVKVAQPGQTLADEVDRLTAVRSVLGGAGSIRIDANGAWDLDTAIDRLGRLNRAAGGLEYAEQPCREVADLARLRRRCQVPIAADESIRRAADPLEVARLQAADLVVMKVQPLGGVRVCLELAEQIELPVVVSSALETSVGLAAGVALAAALPVLDYACGLATAQLLTADACLRPPRPVVGCLPVQSVNPDNLPAISADAATTARWAKRLAEVEGLVA